MKSEGTSNSRAELAAKRQTLAAAGRRRGWQLVAKPCSCAPASRLASSRSACAGLSRLATVNACTSPRAQPPRLLAAGPRPLLFALSQCEHANATGQRDCWGKRLSGPKRQAKPAASSTRLPFRQGKEEPSPGSSGRRPGKG
jgi:hypothetical protein